MRRNLQRSPRASALTACLALLAVLAGCAASGLPATGQAAQAAAAPAQPQLPAAAPERTLADLPWRELWQVVTFDGHKIGYAHLRLEPLEGGLFQARSEVVLRLGYLDASKEVAVRCNDTVGSDFTLRRLDQEALIDGSLVGVRGEVSGHTLKVDISQAGRVLHDRFELGGPVYPAGAMNLVAWLRGLGPGASLSFEVFEPQERRVLVCRQRVAALEQAPAGDEALFEGRALRIETRYAGMTSTAWIRPEGRPLAERAMGVLVTRTADEAAARAALAEARSGKDNFSDYTLVRIEPRLPCSELARLRIEVEGLPASFTPISDARQQARPLPASGGTRAVVYSIDAGAAPRAQAAELPPYLEPSPYVESKDAEIARTAARVVQGTQGREAIGRVVSFVSARLQASAKDRVSALDALRTGEGDCQAHAYLCAALLRASGIPCRIVSGLCYSPPDGGFLYHTWCEAYSGGWLAVDPVTGGPADASHIKLVVGEDIESWGPLADIVGRIRARVLEWRCTGGGRP